jgi:hypothetical protein
VASAASQVATTAGVALSGALHPADRPRTVIVDYPEAPALPSVTGGGQLVAAALMRAPSEEEVPAGPGWNSIWGYVVAGLGAAVILRLYVDARRTKTLRCDPDQQRQ